MLALLLVVAVLGLLVGSFLNVVVWRVPRGESVVRPGSRCPSCGTPIRALDNVPVVSWLLLRGRCRSCGARISVRYPLVELTTALVWVLLAWRLLELDDPWAIPAFLYLGAVAVALALIDIDVHRLPNVITLPSYVVAPLLLLLPAALGSRWDDYLRAFVGMAALYALYFVLWLVHPGGMGFGDVKLAGVLGCYLGWLGYRELLAGAFLGFLLGAVFGVALAVAARIRSHGATEQPSAAASPLLKVQIPYGPYMLLGTLLAILWGAALADAYLRAFGG